MPTRHSDPFTSRAATLNAAVNPYVALLREGAGSGTLPVRFGAELATCTGRWRAHIAEANGLTAVAATMPLVVEIGCHKGATLLAMATAHPNILFLGLDITFKRVVMTAQRAQSLGLRNVYCAMANANGMDKLFAAGELSGCVIFFPDPWNKKARQTKHQLISGEFCQKLARTVAPGGFCWLKTDQESYFAKATNNLQSVGFTPSAERLPPLLERDYSSSFERLFQGQGLPTFGANWLLAEG